MQTYDTFPWFLLDRGKLWNNKVYVQVLPVSHRFRFTTLNLQFLVDFFLNLYSANKIYSMSSQVQCSVYGHKKHHPTVIFKRWNQLEEKAGWS